MFFVYNDVYLGHKQFNMKEPEFVKFEDYIKRLTEKPIREKTTDIDYHEIYDDYTYLSPRKKNQCYQHIKSIILLYYLHIFVAY